MEDKLAAIEERFEQTMQSSTPMNADDVRWLIGEVKRLRLQNGEQRRLANMRSREHWTSQRH
jgi:hypothetical protein